MTPGSKTRNDSFQKDLCLLGMGARLSYGSLMGPLPTSTYLLRFKHLLCQNFGAMWRLYRCRPLTCITNTRNHLTQEAKTPLPRKVSLYDFTSIIIIITITITITITMTITKTITKTKLLNYLEVNRTYTQTLSALPYFKQMSLMTCV